MNTAKIFIMCLIFTSFMRGETSKVMACVLNYGGVGIIRPIDISLFNSLIKSSMETEYGDSLVKNMDAYVLPSITRIKLNKDLYLPAGVYDVRMKVFIEENTSIKKFYTQVDKPCISSEWKIDTLSQNRWVEVFQEMNFSEDANESYFEIFVNNNPDYGGGKGMFYIDDISFLYKKSLSNNVKQSFDFKVFPNPVNNILHIKSDERISYRIYDVRGNVTKASTHMENEFNVIVSDLTQGVYLLQMKCAKGSVVKKIIVQ